MIIGYAPFQQTAKPSMLNKARYRQRGGSTLRRLAARSRIGRLWPRQSWPLAPAMSCWSPALIGYRGQRAIR
jgi:hypothetical protein